MSRYLEAIDIARALLDTGRCEFDGAHYQVNIRGDRALAGVSANPPPLVGSAGGPRALREVTRRVDRIEIKASARSTRGGQLDFAVLPTVTEEEFADQVGRVRAVSAEIPIGVFILTAAGDHPAVSGLDSLMGNSFLGGFCGEPEAVAENLERLSIFGIDRVQLTELAPGSHAALAPYLVGERAG